jgi:antitoxin YefM
MGAWNQRSSNHFKFLGPGDHLAIILAMETLPLAEIKNRLSEFVERVASQHDRVTITRNGRPVAVLVSPDDLESLEETLSILSDTKEIVALRKGLADLDAGRTVTLEDLKAELGRGE